MDDKDFQDSVLDHLHTIALCKKAILQAAVAVSGDYPTEANTLLRVIKSMTSSADSLLGDTITTTIPK